MSFLEEWQRRLREFLEVEEYARCLKSDDRGLQEFRRRFFNAKVTTENTHAMILHVVDRELLTRLHRLEMTLPAMLAEALSKDLRESPPTSKSQPSGATTSELEREGMC
jgi:hypothetical protein